jgi:transglutaminase-like putative cysteine protease
MLRKATSAAIFLLLMSLLPARASAGVPDWLHSLAQQPSKQYPDDANAVILLDDQETTVKDNGEIVTHQRLVFRILRPEGRDYARHSVAFTNETKLSFLRGWSITAKGTEYETKDKDGFERSLSGEKEFDDAKAKTIVLPGADVGTVVGFEYEQRRRPYLFQDHWYFQDMIPVEKSRYTLRLPRNWEYRADWLNHEEQKPLEQNGAYVWEVSSVPRIEREYQEPDSLALAGRMIVTFFSDKATGRNSKSWNDLGLWYSQLTAGVREPSPALQAKVQELAPASLPLFERIRALSLFAQRDVRYFAIEIGIGGLRPHPAAEIFSHRYGDCKDKATVLSTMLAQIGVKSYYMPIHDVRGIYTDKTPPNSGFNHVILAIQMPDPSPAQKLPALYDHPKLGHLLIFDPTNDLVPLGQLPPYEQDSYALLVTDSGGELIHLPVSSPDLNRIHRTEKLKLLPDGTLQGEIEEVRSGYMAMFGRAYLQHQSQSDRRKLLEHFWGPNLGGFQVDSFDLVNENDIDKDLVLRYKFTASHYAKNAGPLLLVRPRVVGEMAGAFDATKPRHYAYQFDAPFLSSDSVEITLPEGYSVDELPEPTQAVYPFAEYTSKAETAGNVLKYTREYKMQATQVPVARMEQLKKLFGQIGVDEKNMAILKKAR